MTEKDLSGLIERPTSHGAPENGTDGSTEENADAFMVQAPIEQVSESDFGSLDNLADPSLNPSPEQAQDQQAPPSEFALENPMTAPGASTDGMDFQVTEQEPPQNFQQEFAQSTHTSNSLENSPQNFDPNLALENNPADSAQNFSADLSSEPTSSAENSAGESMVQEPELSATQNPTEPPPFNPVISSEGRPMEAVKKFSEQLAPNPTIQVSAGFPFSLLIEGALNPEEKEKLLDLLNRENMGIREMDLEPQLDGNRILIPRISEYAGILLVQALRGIEAKMRLGPSDEVFASSDTREQPVTDKPQHATVSNIYSDSNHPAETIPLSSVEKSEDPTQWHSIDLVTASATLKSVAFDLESSSEFQHVLESLQRELKYKAFHKGAHEIHQFNMQIHNLFSPTRFLIAVWGTAVKRRA